MDGTGKTILITGSTDGVGRLVALRLGASGARLVLHEATGYPGGRCRSYLDHTIGITIDNGNHLVLSGNHADINRWRLKQSLGRTWARRPDLLAKLRLTPEQYALLDEYKRELEEAETARET